MKCIPFNARRNHDFWWAHFWLQLASR